MTGLTERQLDWLRDLFRKQSKRKTEVKNPDHPIWQEYDSLQTLASHTTESRASRI